MNYSDTVIKQALLAIYARPDASASKDDLALSISLGLGGDLQNNFDKLQDDLKSLGFITDENKYYLTLNTQTAQDIFFNRNKYITLAA